MFNIESLNNEIMKSTFFIGCMVRMDLKIIMDHNRIRYTPSWYSNEIFTIVKHGSDETVFLDRIVPSDLDTAEIWFGYLVVDNKAMRSKKLKRIGDVKGRQ